MNTSLDNIGQWPISGEKARQNGRLILIPKEKMLNVIHGKENHILVSFFISNDIVHFGTMRIPIRTLSDSEVHKGDEVLFVLEGTLMVETFNNENTEDAVIRKSHRIKKGEMFFIPEGVSHRYSNFYTESVKVLFGIAPDL
jgi:mannose-6-phosphate isomerase-like protein (cupin superfamily)